MADELVDTYDENNVLMGNCMRSKAQAEGLWIRSFHCWLIDKRTRSVIFQKRSDDKKVYPSLWDISAAGHYISGEGLESGVRELQEELGLTYILDDLLFLGIRTEVAKLENAIVREFAYTYFLVGNFSPKDLRPDTVEVSAVSYLTIRDGLAIFSGEKIKQPVETIIPQRGTWISSTDVFSADKVIPRKDPYYLKIFIMAERALERRFPLAI